MSKFTQRTNESSSIIPSGFTGYLVKNSNVIINKSYIEKGTSFINAFDNSNALLKDCGSPYPAVNSDIDAYIKLKRKITNENESQKLPFWFHYNLDYNKNENFAAAVTGQIKLSYVRSHYFDNQPYSDVLNYRNQLLNIASKSNNIISKESTLEYQLIKNNIDSSNIEFTTTGVFYLKNTVSSIRAVFPLNETKKYQKDNPNLIINLKDRQFFNILSSGNPIKINNIYKYDNYGKLIIDDSSGQTLDNTDNYNGYNVHKLIAKSINSSPKYVQDSYQILRTDGDNVLLSIEKGSIEEKDQKNSFKNYLMEPWTSKTIAYKTFNPGGSENKIANATLNNELSLYFKFNDKVYSFFNIINNKIGNETIFIPSGELAGTVAPFEEQSSQTLYDTYLKEKFDLLSNKSVIYDEKNISKQFNFKVDIIKLNNVSTYQPDSLLEDATFIGFKEYYDSNKNKYSIYNKDSVDIGNSSINDYLNNASLLSSFVSLSEPESTGENILCPFEGDHASEGGIFCYDSDTSISSQILAKLQNYNNSSFNIKCTVPTSFKVKIDASGQGLYKNVQRVFTFNKEPGVTAEFDSNIYQFYKLSFTDIEFASESDDVEEINGRTN